MAGLLDILRGLGGDSSDPWSGLREAGKMSPGSQGEIRRGPDGKSYQYAQTTGMRGANGDQGWIETSMQPSGAPRGGILGGLGGGQFGDRLSDLMAGLAMGSNSNDSIAKAGMMIAQGNQGRKEKKLGAERANQTAGWLKTQGVGDQEASYLAGDPDALRAWYKEFKSGNEPDWKITRLLNNDGVEQDFMVDMKNPTRMQPIGSAKKGGSDDFKVVGDRMLRVNNGEVTDVTPAISGAPNGQGVFRFRGSSVEAQSLNGLMDSGQLTPEQAQQLGAGKTITGPNGEILFMTPQGVFGKSGPDAQAQPLGVPQGTAPQRGNIPLTAPKVTVDEKKAMTFADRMATSGKIIDGMGMEGSGALDRMANNVPLAGQYLTSDSFKKVDQAKRDFINAQLRRESGAVISTEEFANAEQQYFPQPNDPPEVIEQKRRNREIVINGMGRDAGPTYTSPVAPQSAPAQGGVVDYTDYFK